MHIHMYLKRAKESKVSHACVGTSGGHIFWYMEKIKKRRLIHGNTFQILKLSVRGSGQGSG